jgi:hypothetical protein
MILDYFENKITPQKWEELCDNCYRMRYQADNYQKIPSLYLGDGGIEGFTKKGIVYQSYCPEKEYTDEELYEHLRDKVTKDISKLLDNNHMKDLLSIGVESIKEWHFVTPEYRDKRILKHLTVKKQEIINAKKSNPNKYFYISDLFDTVIKVAEDFKEEISKTIVLEKGKININLSVLDDDKIDYNNCDSEKISNIIKKIKSIMPKTTAETEINDTVKVFTRFYLRGVEYLNMLKVYSPDHHADIFELINSSKNEVIAQSALDSTNDHILNRKLFDKIMNEFETHMRTLTFLKESSIIELKEDIIAGWLADCSMRFKVDE